jgi:hypothetical protein
MRRHQGSALDPVNLRLPTEGTVAAEDAEEAARRPVAADGAASDHACRAEAGLTSGPYTRPLLSST